MKFQPDTAEGVNLVTRHEPGRVWINGVVHAASVVVPWAGEVQPWNVADPAGLTEAHFERLAAWSPQVVIYGSGAALHFVPPALLRSLIALGIGVETMNTAAACRTYNVLASEGRKVVAALVVAPAAARRIAPGTL